MYGHLNDWPVPVSYEWKPNQNHCPFMSQHQPDTYPLKLLCKQRMYLVFWGGGGLTNSLGGLLERHRSSLNDFNAAAWRKAPIEMHGLAPLTCWFGQASDRNTLSTSDRFQLKWHLQGWRLKCWQEALDSHRGILFLFQYSWSFVFKWTNCLEKQYYWRFCHIFPLFRGGLLFHFHVLHF